MTLTFNGITNDNFDAAKGAIEEEIAASLGLDASKVTAVLAGVDSSRRLLSTATIDAYIEAEDQSAAEALESNIGDLDVSALAADMADAVSAATGEVITMEEEIAVEVSEPANPLEQDESSSDSGPDAGVIVAVVLCSLACVGVSVYGVCYYLNEATGKNKDDEEAVDHVEPVGGINSAGIQMTDKYKFESSVGGSKTPNDTEAETDADTSLEPFAIGHRQQGSLAE